MPPSGTAMTTNSVPRTTRADYHKEALHQIRASLQPFAHGGPRERLSPVVCSAPDWAGPAPPTPPRTIAYHHQPPSPHHLHHVHHHMHVPHHHPSLHHNPAQPPPPQHSAVSSGGMSYDVIGSTNHHHIHPAALPPRSSSSTASTPTDFPQMAGAARHFAYESSPPPPPPRVPSHQPGGGGTPSSPPPQTMPPLLSRLSPGPGKNKPPGPNYVNVSAAGPGRPVMVHHSAVSSVGVMGPPPPYPTQGKPIKVQPPPYQSRQSPAVDRSSPATGSLGPTPPPMIASGGSLGAGAMAVALLPPQHQHQPSYGHAARQAKTPTPVIMQSVRSTHVQKPILQTAVAPPSPPPPSTLSTSSQQQQQFSHYTGASLSSSSSASTITPSATVTPPPPPYTPTPSNASASPYTLPPSASPYTLPPTSSPHTLPPASPLTLSTSSPYTLPVSSSASSYASPYPLTSPSSSPSPVTPPVPSMDAPVPQFDPPSYLSAIQAKAAAADRAYKASSYTTQRGPYSRGSTSPASYGRGCASPALTSIPVQENPVQELDLSSTPLAYIPIDTLSESGGNCGHMTDAYSECDGISAGAVMCSRLSRVMGDTPSTASPRSASPVSSVTSHDTHALSPSPVSCLSTATSSPSTQSDMTLESGYSSSSQSAVRGMLAPPPPNMGSLAQSHSTTSTSSNSVKSSLQTSAGSATTTVTTSYSSAMLPRPPPTPHHNKTLHQSPIPERKKMSNQDQEGGHSEPRVKYSPEAYKFYMEQHVENIIKSVDQRKHREMQLEKEMKKIGLSTKDQHEMRKVLCQKESNFIRLKRAKMNKSMFHHIKTIGVGAFGEVALVRKYDGSKLYAMKTLRKSDVIKRNQVAHVKAERDILAESDNDWVVKLYYSFQDADNLYLIMDYIPGGDLMSLLIKFGIFMEPLARFYIAELVCAIESVHKMGFIHRDIKPDNILIDRDGHIKLTDFGLCTGFRWTHNSRYYQRKGDHARQESMDPCGDNDLVCRCNDLKPLERRRRRQHLRCLAHSLVGTPNYIAPEVLDRKGYSQLCDWWSVGVILYEMLVGQPPFLANTPAETQYKVLNWESCLRIPKGANVSPEAKDLILRLLTSPEQRLGRNAQEIKNHSFFAEVDFEAGLRKQQALYIPEIKYPTDTSNFDPIEPDRLRSENDSDADSFNSNQPYHGFFEFTFRRFFDSTPPSSGTVIVPVGGTAGAGGAAGQSGDDKDVQHPVYV